MSTTISGTTGVDKVDSGVVGFAQMVGSEWENLKATNGYTKLPNGLIMQWILTNSTADGVQVTITFPIPFPNQCLNINITKNGPSNYTGSGDDRVTSFTNTDFLFSAGTVAGQNFIFAIGY